MEHIEAECQTPERQILCVNNCGFFGSATTMNMCSKCHRDLILKQEQQKMAHSSFGSIMNRSRRKNMKEPVVSSNVKIVMPSVAPTLSLPEPSAAVLSDASLMKAKEGPSRCVTCRKRIGLTGFNCRCGNVYCSLHRYSDKHDCQFDYKAFGRDAIAKANPIVRTEKLEKSRITGRWYNQVLLCPLHFICVIFYRQVASYLS